MTILVAIKVMDLIEGAVPVEMQSLLSCLSPSQRACMAHGATE